MLELDIQNLGRIKSGQMELFPLTILVGKNDTGKSYAASLIWALGSLGGLVSSANEAKHYPKWFRELIDNICKQTGEVRYRFGENEIKEIIQYMNSAFTRRGEEFLSKLFAFDGFKDVKIILRAQEVNAFVMTSVTIDNNREKSEGAAQFKQTEFRFSKNDKSKPLIRMTFPIDLFGTNYLSGVILETIIKIGIDGLGSIFSNVYIPASRTGLMLAYPSLVTELFAPNTNIAEKQLPRPLTSFLRYLSIRPPISKNPDSLSQWLCKNIVHGKIEREKQNAAPTFKFVPEGVSLKLPLYATSSMITELSPFLIAFDGGISGLHFILEEPEAHLHLEAQREMARAIARMIAGGARVTLTTHSDTFMQQINNLISLHSHPKKSELIKEFGYEEVDLIDPCKARAYEFGNFDDGTSIRPVELTDEGFIVPSLNDTLLALARETLAIRERQSD